MGHRFFVWITPGGSGVALGPVDEVSEGGSQGVAEGADRAVGVRRGRC